MKILMEFGAGDDGWRSLFEKKGIKVFAGTYEGMKMYKSKSKSQGFGDMPNVLLSGILTLDSHCNAGL